LLSFISNENMFWASASLPFYWSVLFSLLFLYFLARNALLSAGLVCGLAMFTSGGGLVLLPLAWVYLLLKRRYKGLIFFGIYSLLLAGIYFFSYRLTQTAGGVFQLASFPRYVRYFVIFLGAPLELLTFIPGLAMGSGLVGVALLAVLWVKNRQDEFTWLIIGFTVLIALEAAALRSSMGLEQALSSRYMIYPLLFWCSLLFLSAKTFFGRFRIQYLIFALLAGLLFGMYIAVKQEFAAFEIQAIQKSSSIRAFQYGYSQSLLDVDVQQDRKILLLTRELGVYDYKSFEMPIASLVRYQQDNSIPLGPLEVQIEWFDRNRISGWAFIPGQNSNKSEILVLLNKGTETFALRTYRNFRPYSSEKYVNHLYDSSGFEAFVYAHDVPSGEYKVGILVINGGKQGVYWLDKVITYP